MKLSLKLSKSKSSSAHGSPLASPITPSSPAISDSTTPLSPHSPSTPAKPAGKSSLLAEKGKPLQLRLPSLPRSRSRSSKREITVASSSEPSSKPPLSPLGQSSSNGHMHLQSNGNMHPRSGPENGSFSGGARQEPLMEEIKRVFEKFDSNSDGKISADELQSILRALGDNITRREAELMVAEADTDSDGFIDLQEFITLNVRGNGGNGQALGDQSIPADELAATFNMFDLDKDGCITPKELHCVLGNLGNHTSTLEDCKRMICSVDRKGCGYVDFDDFKVMMATSSTTIMA